MRSSAVTGVRHASSKSNATGRLGKVNIWVYFYGSIGQHAGAKYVIFGRPDPQNYVLANWQVYLEIGKLASLLAVTVTPQKDTNVRPPVGGPCLLGGVLLSNWFFLSSFSLGR